MIEKNFIHKIGELEEAAGVLQQIEGTDGSSALVRISYRWYEIPHSLAGKIKKTKPESKIAILRLDGRYYLRIEGKEACCHV